MAPIIVTVAAILAAGSSCRPMPATPNTSPGTVTSSSPSIPTTQTVARLGAAVPKKEAPLLLLDDAPDVKTSADQEADNSRCQVCHLNLVQEELAITHARANVGCARCHGASDAHIADESWASGGNGTAPDLMYLKAKVNPLCLGCHTQDKISADRHKDFLAGNTPEKYCTDCHGKHCLPIRKCRWK